MEGTVGGQNVTYSWQSEMISFLLTFPSHALGKPIIPSLTVVKQETDPS